MKVFLKKLFECMMKFSPNNVELIKELMVNAGQLIKKIRNKSFVLKKDKSPVTLADLESNKLICEGLKKNFPYIPIVSEESKKKIIADTFFLVDPLDGTKEFLKNRDDFTVNIAFVYHKVPTYGFVFAPNLDELYWNDDEFSFLKKKKRISKISVKDNFKKIYFEVSNSHLDINTYNFINTFESKIIKKTGSSLKICNLAKGKSNLYPRFLGSMEWDIAAGHSILKKAGGNIFTLNNNVLTYGKSNFKNGPFLGIGCKRIPPEILRKLPKTI